MDDIVGPLTGAELVLGKLPTPEQTIVVARFLHDLARSYFATATQANIGVGRDEARRVEEAIQGLFQYRENVQQVDDYLTTARAKLQVRYRGAWPTELKDRYRKSSSRLERHQHSVDQVRVLFRAAKTFMNMPASRKRDQAGPGEMGPLDPTGQVISTGITVWALLEQIMVGIGAWLKWRKKP